jgi:hypothetical protein
LEDAVEEPKDVEMDATEGMLEVTNGDECDGESPPVVRASVIQWLSIYGSNGCRIDPFQVEVPQTEEIPVAHIEDRQVAVSSDEQADQEAVSEGSARR